MLVSRDRDIEREGGRERGSERDGDKKEAGLSPSVPARGRDVASGDGLERRGELNVFVTRVLVVTAYKK